MPLTSAAAMPHHVQLPAGALRSLQLAPGGVIELVHPLEGNAGVLSPAVLAYVQEKAVPDASTCQGGYGQKLVLTMRPCPLLLSCHSRHRPRPIRPGQRAAGGHPDCPGREHEARRASGIHSRGFGRASAAAHLHPPTRERHNRARVQPALRSAVHGAAPRKRRGLLVCIAGHVAPDGGWEYAWLSTAGTLVSSRVP